MNTHQQHGLGEMHKLISDPLVRLARQETERLNKIGCELVRQFVEPLQERLETVVKSTQEMIDRAEVDARKMAPLLGQASFWLSPSMSMDLFDLLKAVTESEEASPDCLASTIVEYYADGEWAELDEMISSWQDNPYFTNRMHIINDALDAHIDGKYTLVIPALLSQVEGIASSILETPAGSSTGLVKCAVTERLGEFWKAPMKDNLIKFITSPAGYGSVGKKEPGYFTVEKFPEWLKSKGVSGSQSINRHGILHGVHVDYASKENSLRVFLLLDVLCYPK